MNRRSFLAAGGVAAGMVAAAPSAQFRKSICSIIFPREMPLEEQFRLTRDAGFEGLEVRIGDEVTMDSTADQLQRWGDGARRMGVTVVSLWVSQPLSSNLLNSPDPAVRARGVAAIEKAIDFAGWIGCGALLLVPCRLGDGATFKVGYQDTWDRVTAELKKNVPHATKSKILLTPENVGNKFLLSPLEMRAFVDQFRSPWVQAHFDVGNVMQFGYPEDWILTLGPRLKRIHVKDYKLPTRTERGRMVNLMEGDVNWKGVMAALGKVGYRGFISPEINRNEEPDQLRKISAALDRILAMA
jgi:hexulose-6-phosphate isomerase